MTRRRIAPRKLLIASVGVATLNYLGVAPAACGGTVTDEQGNGTGGTAGAGPGGAAGAGGKVGVGGKPSSAGANDRDASTGNLMPPPTPSTPPPFPTVANLMAPPPNPTVPPPFPTVANLMAPPPPPPRVVDAGADADDGGNGAGPKK